MEGRVGIRRIFEGQLLGPEAVPDDVPRYLRHWIRYDGAQIMPPNPEFTKAGFDAARWAHDFYPNWYVNKVNGAFLFKFLDLAKAHDIDVYWLLPPLLPSIQAEIDKSGFAAKHTDFMRRLQAKYPNLSVLDGRQAGYDEATYMDGNHLGRPGAYVVSVEVARLLGRRLAEGHPQAAWLDLPKYQELPVDVAIQDADHPTPIGAGETLRR
jgi:hypothetical protein